jgi:LDH2 family malate/lactate/ureidoglycolate dehydrogenase
MTDEKDQRERLAIVEHRADQLERGMLRIEHYIQKLTEQTGMLVKVQADTQHANRAIERMHERLDKEINDRLEQHQQTRQWASDNEGRLSTNASWIGYMKMLLAGGFGAFITVGLTHLLTSVT